MYVFLKQHFCLKNVTEKWIGSRYCQGHHPYAWECAGFLHPALLYTCPLPMWTPMCDVWAPFITIICMTEVPQPKKWSFKVKFHTSRRFILEMSTSYTIHLSTNAISFIYMYIASYPWLPVLFVPLGAQQLLNLVTRRKCCLLVGEPLSWWQEMWWITFTCIIFIEYFCVSTFIVSAQ